MPTIRKSASSRQNIIPYIRSASSKLSLAALSSTSSISALFSSSTSFSGSSKSIFMSGIRGIVSGKDDNGNDKENTSPSHSDSNGRLSPNARAKSSKGRSKKGRGGSGYPEISAPKMTADSLEAVRAKFTLVPLKKVEPCSDGADMVIVNTVDYHNAPRPQIGARF